MTNWPVHARIDGPIVMIGFGSIGKGTLPLIERHFNYDKSRFVVIDPEDKDRKLLDERGIRFIHQAVTKDNYRHLLTPLLTDGGGQGFCVNLSVDTSSLDIMEFCNEIGALYIDTVNEPWPGFYFDPKLGPEARSNYALREATLAAKRARKPGSTTAVSCCGANPGMVSWFVKQALLNVAGDIGLKFKEPKTREEWGRLAKKAGVKGIHIAERDTQRAKQPKPLDIFVNTWSVEGFVSEGMQPAELGWGTHEKWMPANGRKHKTGCQAAIYLLQPGANTRVRSWTPTAQGAIRLPGHPQRVDLDRRLLHPAQRPQDHLPADLPLCLSSVQRRGAVAARDVRPGRQAPEAPSTFSTSTRSSTASTNSACCSTATRRTPIGTARSSRSTRRARSRPIRTPPACR